MRFTIYQESRPGGRPNNEDRIAHCYSRNALLMVVADGMGGHLHGEIAAQITAQTMIHAFQRSARPDLADPFLFLHEEVRNAHESILEFTRKHALRDAPRTTMLACVIQHGMAYWIHAGDSRLYLIRRKRIVSQTRDHSRVRYLLDEGLITAEQALTHPDRNKVYSCLGGPVAPEVEFSRKTPLEINDVLVLCTDGVWGSISNEILVQAMTQPDLMRAAPRFLKELEERNGAAGDNLSMIAVRWEEETEMEEAETESPGSILTQTMATDEVNASLFGKEGKTDFTDQDIEEAIREIQAAIEKNQAERQPETEAHAQPQSEAQPQAEPEPQPEPQPEPEPDPQPEPQPEPEPQQPKTENQPQEGDSHASEPTRP
jgi:serine/threonine protein phosphatase PrpC